MKIVSASFIAAFAIACTTTNPAAPKPGTDPDPDVESCEPGEVLGCGDDNTLRVCDETGTVVTEACSAGCNAEANRFFLVCVLRASGGTLLYPATPANRNNAAVAAPTTTTPRNGTRSHRATLASSSAPERASIASV